VKKVVNMVGSHMVSKEFGCVVQGDQIAIMSKGEIRSGEVNLYRA